MIIGGLLFSPLPVFCSGAPQYSTAKVSEWLGHLIREEEFLPVYSALIRLRRAFYAVQEQDWYVRTHQVWKAIDTSQQTLPEKRDRIQIFFEEIIADPLVLARLDNAKVARRRLGLSQYPEMRTLKSSDEGIARYEALLRGLRRNQGDS